MLIRNCRHLYPARAARLHRLCFTFNNHVCYGAGNHGGHMAGTLTLRFASTNDGDDEQRKLRQMLRMLKEDLQMQEKQEEEEEKRMAKKEPLKTRLMHYVKNPREVGRVVWAVCLHYFHGFRLFFLEARLTMKYLWKLRSGKALSRKERQQLVRTLADTIRLGPFLFFIIVPFMDFFIPIYIKLFPTMMPSTFQHGSDEEQSHRKQVKFKIESARFLQEALEEVALMRKKSGGGKEEPSRAYEFSQFLRKAREEGSNVTNADLFEYIKLFEDELTLDNLAMSQLRALCRMLGISKMGPPELLRTRLLMKLRELKADDKLIVAEGGVEVLSVPELQSACRARGMRAIGLSEERLHRQLKQWLELSLNDQVPPSLLLLSRAIYFPEESKFAERLRTIIAQLPDEIGEQTTFKLKEIEGTTDAKSRIELLKSIEKELKRERKIAKEANNKSETAALSAAVEAEKTQKNGRKIEKEENNGNEEMTAAAEAEKTQENERRADVAEEEKKAEELDDKREKEAAKEDTKEWTAAADKERSAADPGGRGHPHQQQPQL